MSPDLHVNKISGYLSPGSQTVKRAINPVQLAARPSDAAASGRGEHGRPARSGDARYAARHAAGDDARDATRDAARGHAAAGHGHASNGHARHDAAGHGQHGSPAGLQTNCQRLQSVLRSMRPPRPM